MTNIIVLFPKNEDAKNVRNLLVRHGFRVSAVCTTGAQALASANGLGDGIVVCGFKYPDMMYSELKTLLPSHFEMLLLASQRVWGEYGQEGVVCVAMPLKVHELISTLEMMAASLERRRKKRKEKPAVRSDADRKVLDEAKMILMERNGMSEDEAHRYLQKCSMDSGTNRVEKAQMVMSMMRFLLPGTRERDRG